MKVKISCTEGQARGNLEAPHRPVTLPQFMSSINISSISSFHTCEDGVSHGLSSNKSVEGVYIATWPFLFLLRSPASNPVAMLRTETTGDLNALRESLPPEYQEDFDIVFGGPNPQHIVFTDIPYFDHNNNKRIIVSAVYSVVHKTLPSLLPTLLPPLQSPPAYAMRDIPGKGKGMVATRDIALSEIVIIERPILLSPRLVADSYSLVGIQIHAKQSMNQEDRIKYSNLVNVNDNISKFDGIRYTNAFGIELQEGKEMYSAVFLELSRLNHSCGPNLRGIWDPHLFTFSVQAVRPIRAGQELTVTYVDIFLPCADRRFTLQNTYKFECKCPYCTKSSAASDRTRAASRLDDTSRYFEFLYNYLVRPGIEIPRHLGRHETKMVLNLLTGRLGSITNEGIEAVVAPVFYTYLMKLSGVLGDKKNFKEWGFKAILSSVGFGGKAHRDIEQWIEWMRDPKMKFPEWGRYQ